MAAAVEMRGEGQSHQTGTQVHEGREKKVIKMNFWNSKMPTIMLVSEDRWTARRVHLS